ncbi:MAG: contractile injection system tape measure protein [Bacteroidia bacterium]
MHLPTFNRSPVFRNRVIPRLERLFDQMVGPDTVIRLDGLEIDAGRLDPAQLEESMITQILPQVEAELREKLAGLSMVKKNAGEGIFSMQMSLVEAFCYFLEKGFFPWWIKIEDWKNWLDVLVGYLFGHAKEIEVIVALLRENESAQTRFFHQAGDGLKKVIGEKLPVLPAILDNETWAVIFFHILSVAKKPSSAIREWITRTLYFYGVLDSLSGKTDREVVAKWLYDFKREFYISDREMTSGLLAYLKEHERKADRQITLLIPLLREWVNENPEGKKKMITQNNFSPKTDFPEKNPNDELNDSFSETNFPEKALSEKKDNKAKPEEGTEIYIENAGLVLMHPFLPNYFQELRLLTDGKFQNEESRERAVLLTQFLCAGETQFAEHTLVLNKILCGLPLGVPVLYEYAPSEKEIEETDTLLRAVVGHWKALKNTSPDGLRHNFLLREGKLIFMGSGWKLFVEQKPQDVLLGQLPWGVSRIQLSWMPDLLNVDWN